MTDKPQRIVVSDLPPRPRQPEEAELRNVFGGCRGRGETCHRNEECCSGNCMRTSETSGRCWTN